MDTLEQWLTIHIKKIFNGKEKKINVLTALFTSIKIVSKLF